MSKHSKRRQSRLGRVGQKPTDQRRNVAGEPGYTQDAVDRILGEKRTKVVEVVRQRGGLRYNVVVRGVPRTFKVNPAENNA